MTRMKFTAENIAAILIASTTCGSYREVIESSGTDLAPSTLHGWISRGNRDIKNNKDTAWSVFVTEWNSSHIKLPNDSEIKRMAEVKRALEMVEVARSSGKPDDLEVTMGPDGASGKPDGGASGKPDGKIIAQDPAVGKRASVANPKPHPLSPVHPVSNWIYQHVGL